MQIVNPQSTELIQKRNQLLQSTLRKEFPDIPIASEYPLVLNTKQQQYSFCIVEDGEVVAHLNFFPRTLQSFSSKQTHRVALIGNVATSPQHRGKGCMRHLFLEIESIAKENGISKLILWSDLSQFYQKLGYQAFGKERRLTFTRQALAEFADRSRHFLPINSNQLTATILRQMLGLRPKVRWTLQRTPDEFANLLNIPSTFCVFRKHPLAFGICGRGVDLRGIVHEWGADNPKDLGAILFTFLDLFQNNEIMLLAPEKMSSTWESFFELKADQIEYADVGWMKSLDGSPNLDDCFIWGMDSI